MTENAVVVLEHKLEKIYVKRWDITLKDEWASVQTAM